MEIWKAGMSESNKTIGLEYSDYKDFVEHLEAGLCDAAARSQDAERWWGQKCMDASEYENCKRNNTISRVRFRTPYQHDRDSILYSSSFASLAGKTQMLIGSRASILRTRLTHSLFVSQIARSIGRGLALNEDLIDAMALGHDLGHTPFAHAGEWALNEWLNESIDDPRANQQQISLEAIDLRQSDPVAEELRRVFLVADDENSLDLLFPEDTRRPELFMHAKQSFKRLCVFEDQNPTKQVLFGIWRHSGRYAGNDKQFGYTDPNGITFNPTYATYEAQVVRLSDDIAWVAHDVQDAIQAGLIDPKELHRKHMGHVGPEKLTLVERAGDRAVWINSFIHDAIQSNYGNLEKDALASGEGNIDLSADSHMLLKTLKESVYEVHNNEEIKRSNQSAMDALKRLCSGYMDHYDKFIEDVTKVHEKRDLRFHSPAEIKKAWSDNIKQMALICDFVSSLTDEEAFKLHERHYSAEAYIKPMFSL